MKKIQGIKNVFEISIEDLQSEAIEKLGRTLTEVEIDIAKKGLEEGLLFDIDTVYGTIFSEMIKQ
jgi:hypothetical protein